MISKRVLEEIDKKMKSVASSFGGPTELVMSMSRAIGADPPSLSDKETEYEVAKLLYNPDITATISPWSYRFSIADYSEYGTLKDESIILEEPYQVYSTSGKLLYSVSSHQGVFGNSLLDKALVLESESGKTYYLQFPTYLGYTRTIQLIVNRVSVMPPISLPQFKPKPTIAETNSRNSIYLKATSSYRNSSLTGNPILPIRLHMQRTNSAIRPTPESVIANADSTTNFLMEIDDTVIFHPQESAWVVLTQSTSNGLRMLRIGNVSGQGTSRLLEVSLSYTL